VTLTPAQRSMRARIAANTRWSRDGERKANAERAQRGLLAKFEAEVDPDGVLPEAERLHRATEARLREHDSAQASWEAYDDPAVHRLRNHIVNRATVEAETRARLRREVPEPEPTSPARRALARSDDEKRREMTWSQFTPNGWGPPDDNA
jgi:hypothetical protein